MDFLGGNILFLGLELRIFLLGIGVFLLVGTCFSIISTLEAKDNENPNLIQSLWLFFYSCFLKPHEGDSKGNQQNALESFYKSQAGAYDATRRRLLSGREDMLALAAAQLALKAKGVDSKNTKNIWVDVRGQNQFLGIIALIQMIDRWWDWLEH